MNLTFSLVFLCGLLMTGFQAVAAVQTDAVTVKDKHLYAINEGQQKLLTEDLTFPEKVMISTNGTFKVGKGKDRVLQERQILRRDGWLVNTDGSVQPVVDHVGIKNARPYIMRDGQSTPLTTSMVFPNGMTLNPDCSGSNLPGGRNRVLDGQLFRMDGTSIQSKDTVTFNNGQVVVQKDGTLIPLGSAQMMGMSDGTKVFGRGAMQKIDGTIIDLVDGQTVLVDGAYYGR